MAQKLGILFLLLFSLATAQEENYVQEPQKSILQDLVWEWSEAYDQWDLAHLKKLYGASLLFYGQQLPREQCITRVSSQLNPNEVIRQEIISPILLTVYEGDIIKADFIKKISRNGNARHYPCYLLIKHNGTAYEVVGESDRITDDKMNYKLDLGNKLNGSEDPEESGKKELTYLWLIAGAAVFLSGLAAFFRKRRAKQKNKPE